jgi:hypothetical protein
MVVQARLNGNHPPNYHPNLPVTIQALVGAALIDAILAFLAK